MGKKDPKWAARQPPQACSYRDLSRHAQAKPLCHLQKQRKQPDLSVHTCVLPHLALPNLHLLQVLARKHNLRRGDWSIASWCEQAGR